MNSTFLKSKWLLLREFYSLIIRVFASFFLMRLIGPKEYGVYISAVNVITFVTAISQMGVNIYLVKEAHDKDILRQSFTFSFISSVIATVICAGFSAMFLSNLKGIFLILIPAIIISNMRVTSLGILEKDIEYKKISIIELNTQVIFYLLSFFLYKLGNKGLGIAYLTSVLYSSVHTIFSHPVPFSFMVPSKKMVKFGIQYSFSNLCLQSKNLINIALLYIIGATNVGRISFAMKLCEGANIIKDTTRRVSLKTFSVKSCSASLIDKAILFQVFSVSSIMVSIIFILPLIGRIMGKDWCSNQDILLFTAMFYSISSFFTIQYFFLTIIEKNVVNGLYLLTQNLLIIIVTRLLFSSLDIYAYCISLLIANISGIIPITQLMKFKLNYKKPFLYLSFFILLIILSRILWWAPILSLTLILLKDTREILKFITSILIQRKRVEDY